MQTANIWNLYNLSSKKVTLLSILLIIGFSVQAQNNIRKHDDRNLAKRYSYGIHLAFNQQNFRVEHSDNFLEQDDITSIEGTNDLGLEVGIIGVLHPIESLELRAIPTITFGNRGLNFYDINDEETFPYEESIESTLFDLPIQLKYKSKPYKDFRMFVIAGGKYRQNLSYKEPSDNQSEERLRFTKSDFMGELGAGAEFHFPLFTLAPELKISQGFMNQREQNDANSFSSNISGLYSRMYTLSINIE